MRKMLKSLMLAVFCGTLGIAAAAEWQENSLQTAVQRQELVRVADSSRRIAATRRRGRHKSHGRHKTHNRRSMRKWTQRAWHTAWNMNWNRLEKKMYP